MFWESCCSDDSRRKAKYEDKQATSVNLDSYLYSHFLKSALMYITNVLRNSVEECCDIHLELIAVCFQSPLVVVDTCRSSSSWLTQHKHVSTVLDAPLISSPNAQVMWGHQQSSRRNQLEYFRPIVWLFLHFLSQHLSRQKLDRPQP